ncbi:30S ribosomal protein S2 [Phormidium pseudopriestleyi FRX01]|uniref:30S ribosomal protein S2 n=1 Tax=Phormidium pseudopriestleyi FRX01 TaxID=1759528 RepID=A0ABS3FUY5_9CYAN|nr:30S ribosomal protein S2 [Phormidium pseudopriestleyi]MBO0350799.1 30S ribosomal protein S2 [Phormidium pseudopriestleyi FRX01]
MARKPSKHRAKINQKSRDARTLMKRVCKYIEAPSNQGKTFLIVGTKPRTSELVDKLAKRYKDKIFYCKNSRKVYRYKTGQQHCYVNRLYSGKILTKFSKLQQLERLEELGKLDKSKRKEIVHLQRQLNYLRGIKRMDRLPDAVIILDRRSEYKVLIDECRDLGIKVIYFNKSPLPPVETSDQIREKINDTIENTPELNQLNKLRSQANPEDWNQLVDWLLGQAKRSLARAIEPLAELLFDVDFEQARNHVAELQTKYPNHTRDEIANILIKETLFKVARISYIEDLTPEDINYEIKNAISCVANCDLKTITQECAEMVFKIAGIYDFDLNSPIRQFEALAAFGIAWLGKRAINAGIGWLDVDFFDEINIRAVSHALMIFTVGNAARLFYKKAKLERDTLLDNPTKFERFLEDNRVLEDSRSSDLYTVQDDEDLTQVINEQFSTNPNNSEPETSPNTVIETRIIPISPIECPRGVDYSKLEKLLKYRKWKAADHETRRIMLEVVKRTKWFDDKSIHGFSQQHLSYINHLWKTNSNDRFGFSQQKRIYELLGGTGEYNPEVWSNFAETVGWKQEENWLYYADLQFDTAAPEGHLPAVLGHQKHLWGLGDIQGSRLRLLLSREDF